jgi:hypothetical protein
MASNVGRAPKMPDGNLGPYGSADGTFPPLGINGPYDGDRSPAPADESMTSVHSSPPMGPSPWRRPTVPSSPGRDSGPNGEYRV